MMDVSVIIPAYNRLWCLPAAIDSCRNTLCKTEIIVVDDGSTDGTWEWLKEQHDLVIIKQDNLGKCWAVNKGFEIAKGKYIKFLDSDDQVTGGAIDSQFNIAEENLSDIVVSGYILIDENNNQLKQQPWFNCDDFIAQQLGECDGSHYAAFLFNKNILADIPHRPDYAFRDDRMLILEVALKNPKIAVHSGYALMHRVHNNIRLQFNSGLQQAVQNFQHINIYKYIINRLKLQGNLNKRRISASINVLWPLAHWIAKEHLREAQNVVNFIYELDPDFKIPDAGFLGKLYRTIGFYKTEKLLYYRRLVKGLF